MSLSSVRARTMQLRRVSFVAIAAAMASATTSCSIRKLVECLGDGFGRRLKIKKALRCRLKVSLSCLSSRSVVEVTNASNCLRRRPARDRGLVGTARNARRYQRQERLLGIGLVSRESARRLQSAVHDSEPVPTSMPAGNVTSRNLLASSLLRRPSLRASNTAPAVCAESAASTSLRWRASARTRPARAGELPTQLFGIIGLQVQ